jgi:hypothetical protein
MHEKVDGLIGERNCRTGEARTEQRTHVSGKTIFGTPSFQRM